MKGVLFHQVLLFVKARLQFIVFWYPCLRPYASMPAPSRFNCMCMLAMLALRIDE